MTWLLAPVIEMLNNTQWITGFEPIELIARLGRRYHFVSLSAAFVANFVEFLQKSSVSTEFATKAADEVYSGKSSI